MVAPGNQEVVSFFLVIPEISTSLGTFSQFSLGGFELHFWKWQMVYGVWWCNHFQLPYHSLEAHMSQLKRALGKISSEIVSMGLTKVNQARETQTAGQMITHRGKERTHPAEIWSDKWRKTHSSISISLNSNFLELISEESFPSDWMKIGRKYAELFCPTLNLI